MTDRIDTAKEREWLDKLTGHTPGPWRGHNMVHEEGRQMTPEELGEYVCNSVKMGDLSRFLFVSGKHDHGGDCDVCHTGNGPRGPANTALIAAAPDLLTTVHRLLDEIERLREVKRLVLAANTLREEYHALPNDKNRPGQKESRKSRAKRLWLRAFSRADRAARAALKGGTP